MPRKTAVVRAETTKLTPRTSKTYDPTVTAEVRSEQISESVALQTAILAHMDRVNLNDTEAVRSRTIAYFEQCAKAKALPTFLQLCTFLGSSRQWVMKYCETHATHDTVVFLDQVQCACAAILEDLGLRRVTDPAVTIFILKNSRQGLKDNPVDPVMQTEAETNTEAADLAARYKQLYDQRQETRTNLT